MCELWNENIKWKPELEVDAVSYNAWITSLLPQVATMTPGTVTEHKATTIPLGNKIFHVRDLPKTSATSNFFMGTTRTQRTVLNTYYGGRCGEVCFTDTVKIPILTDGNEVWMSLTPMEVFSQRAGLRKARGSVLIGGLGMGWFARRVLERKQVTKVLVAETNRAILQYFGKPLKEEFGDRLVLRCGDVYDQDAGKYDSCLLDIWPNICDAKDDEQLMMLMSWHPNVWAWGKEVNGR